MRLSTIPAIRRNLHRAREIFGVLSKYGLAEWIRWLGPGFAKDLLKGVEGDSIARQKWQARLRMAMTELGPSTIKLGQFLSTRPDLVGVQLADEFKCLQRDVPADPFPIVRKVIEASLKRPLEELFDEFDEQAMASGSIGQVHRARLKETGEEVVVKVQHPNIQHKLEVDLDILATLAHWAERSPEFKNYNPTAVIKAFRRSLLRELDFERELRHMERFGANFAKNETVRIPRVHRAYSTGNVLTMERLDGVKLTDQAGLREAGHDLEQIARAGAEFYLDMIFRNRFYHADPHPGNILVLEGGVIGVLDFGSVGQLDESLQEAVEDLLLAITAQETDALASIIMRIGQTPLDLDRAGLGIDLDEFISYYGAQTVDAFDVGGALNEMMEIVRRYQIMLPPRLAMLIKTIVTLEGTAQLLSPQFSLLEMMRPYRFRMLRRRLSPQRQMRRLRRFLSQAERAMQVLPEGIVDIVHRLQTGRFAVHLDHQGLEPSVNRLVLGLLTSALFLGSALMVSQSVGPLVGDVGFLRWIPGVQETSLPGGIGMLASVVLGLRILRAIHRSGDLD